MIEYRFENRGENLLEDFSEALEKLYAATQALAQYTYEEHNRDRYSLLEKVAHCCDYYYLAEPISKCFHNLSEREQDHYFCV